MIPLKLELTNFLSYRDTAVLAFNDIQLACIAGANGAGKSSILDGITYALFGKSRSKSDDDLVNRLATLNDEAATVRFTFMLEGVPYRVTRQRKFNKSSTLELQIQTENEDWKILTQSKLRETQAEIEKLLRMNYDTFINASFLLQGKADEFTTKTPNKRKEILADLLGLGEWEVYKAAAMDRRKQSESQVSLLDAQLQEIEAELAEEADREAALAAAQENHTAVAARLADKQRLLEELRRTEAAIEQQKSHIQNLNTNRLRAEKSLKELQETEAKRQAERAEYQNLIAQAEAIEADYAAWQSLNEEVQTWQGKAETYNTLLQQKQPFALTIAQEESRLNQRRQELVAQQETAVNAAAEIEQHRQEIQALQSQLSAITASLAEVSAQEAEWHEGRAELQRLEGEQTFQQRELSQLRAQAKQTATLQKEQKAVSANLAEAQEMITAVAAEIEVVQASKQQLDNIQAELKGLESTQPALRGEFKKARERMAQLEEQAGGDCPLCGQPLSDSHRKNVLEQLQNELQTLEARGKTNNERLDSLTTEIADLTKVVQTLPQLEQKRQMLQNRLTSAETRLPEIEKTLSDWEENGQVRLAALEASAADQTALATLREKLAGLDTAVKEKERLDKQRQEMERDLAAKEARIAELERLQTRWQTEGQEELQTVSQRLADQDFDAEAQTALARLEDELAAVAYDQEAHHAARDGLKAIAPAPEKRQQLQQAQAAVKPLEDALADLAKQIEEQMQVVADLQTQHDTAVADLETLTAAGSDLRQVEAEVQQLREDENRANRQVGAAQNRLAILDDQRRRRESLTAERLEVTKLVQRLTALEKAFGREGVQALLIEQAIPEIEDRANDLLDRLTGGEMRVEFQTQRSLKSRDALAETLDIQIRDNAGVRPYDNFSGGEQFRVNFAIRLALSQVLANRAGARLQTLVIDEGFGSQDPIGRQRLVEAINLISADFTIILVITHIDELKDAFSTRIQIEKRPSGSTISII